MKTVKILLVFLIVITLMPLSLGCFQREKQPEEATGMVKTEKENTVMETTTETIAETATETVT